MKFRGAFRTHLSAANSARDERRWAEARIHYEAALAEDPQRDAIWVQLGHARKELGDHASAEAAYRKALALRADVPDTHLQLGHLLKITDRMSEAIASYSKAARLQPGPSDALKELTSLGYTSYGHRIFAAELGRPSVGRRSRDTWWFSLEVKLQGITAAEALLQQQNALQLGYALHNGSSSSAARHTGSALLSKFGESRLMARFILPATDTARQAQLVKAGFRYESADDVAEYRFPQVWLLIQMRDDSLATYYKELTAG